MRVRWGGRRAAAGHPVDVARRELAEELPIGKHADHLPGFGHDREGVGPEALEHPGRGGQGVLGPKCHDLGAHQVAHHELAFELLLAEGRQRQDLARRPRRQERRGHVVPGQHPREGGHGLEVGRGVPGRSHDQQDHARLGPTDRARVPLAGRDGCLGDAQRHDQPAHRVGPEVREPRVRPETHGVLGPALPDRLVQPRGLGDAAVGDAGIHQHPQSLLERGRRKRHHHPARREEVGEPHILDRSSSTTSTGRRMMPIPAASKAASFSSAVPDEPEMIAPA